MTDGPTIDERTRDELYEIVRTRAMQYTDDWDPATEDPGTTLLALFSRFGADVINRLNDVPNKHRVAFLDALDFVRRPPQSARVPVTFTTTPDIATNIVVPGGTQVIAEAVEGGDVTFEIPGEDGFEATPASLAAVFSVDPGQNRIFSHSSSLGVAGDVDLFRGTDRQRHALFLGHEDLLNLAPGATVTVTFETTAGTTLEERVEWAYFGEADDAEDDDSPDWHPLPVETPHALDEDLEEEATLGEKMRQVSDRLQRLEERTAAAQEEDVHELTFHLPGQTATTAVAGVESRWIRGQVRGETDEEFAVEIETVRFDVEGGAVELERRRPSMVLSNDVPLSIEDEDIYPFGRLPQPPTTLYLAAEEALTKRDGTVDIQFAPPEDEGDPGEDEDDDAEADRTVQLPTDIGGPLSGPPEISWEYWNGNGWTRLVLAVDDTDAFRSPGHISFSVPPDLEETSVSGHSDYWIRARLVGGNYGTPEYEMTEAGGRGRLLQRPDPPKYGDIVVQYGQSGATFDQTITDNNGQFQSHEPHVGDEDTREEPLVPFVPLPDDSQAIYLGFDAPLREGPINLHIPMRDKAYPREFDPGIRWEYCVNLEGWRWNRLDVRDGTEGLTERGIVNINFPEETDAIDLFGQERYWVRARVTRDPFGADGSGVDGSGQGGRETSAPAPPSLEAITPNTQWAYNERTVSEVLGGSDGSPRQSFRCTNAPITDAGVWVDEGDALSRAERRELVRERPEDVRHEPVPGDESDEVWVRWREVPDFLDSDDDARHYRLDRANGVIDFGDGQEGAIPPTGEANLEVTYQAGGGSEGNVPAEAVTELRSPISRIDAVTNFKPSDGGTDIESLDDAVERSPRQIKTRGRAVAADDFEHLAEQASRQVAKVRCEPELDDVGAWTPGWVTLLIIPRERRDRPIPSLELRQRVKDEVSKRAPVTLVGQDANRMIVRGPDYCEVSIETTVGTEGVESITNLKSTIEAALETFFHPLTGNRDGAGWEFGMGPRLSQVTTLIEGTPGVRQVRDIAMTVDTAGEEKIIRDPGSRPTLSRDEIISSGTHDVSVVLEERT